MSRKIDLKDAKEGMWIEFDDADGHYAGELHEMRDSEDIIHSLILSMSDRPPLYIETEDEGNLVILMDFGDGYRHGSARNVHVYESKPETESVKQAEDDGGHQFWEGKTCKEMAGLHVKVTFKNGDVVTGVTNQIGDIDSVHYLSAGTGDDLFVPNKRIASIELVDDAPRERITDIAKVRPGDKVVMKNGNEYTAVNVCPECTDGSSLQLNVEGFGIAAALWAEDSAFQYGIENRTRWPTFRRSQDSTRLAPNRCGSMTANVGCRCSPTMAPSPPPSHASPNPAASSSRPVSGMIVSRSRRWRRASSDFHPETGLQVREMPVGSRGQDHAPPMPHMRRR